MSTYEDLRFAPMLITDVFETMKAAGEWFDLSKANLLGKPAHPYVARSGGGNGIGSVIPAQDAPPPNAGNCVTVGVSTSTVFYQPVDFYTSKEIQVLRHPRLTSSSGLVLVTVLREQMGKFQWGNGASLDRLAATRIMVPVTQDEGGNVVADWDGMERFGKELMNVVHTRATDARPGAVSDSAPLPTLTFAPKLLTDVFESMKASTAWYDKSALDRSGPAIFPFVSRTKADNGVDGFCSLQKKGPEEGSAITIGLDTQTVGFQPVPFYTSQNIQVLRHSRLTEWSAAVLMTVIRTQLRKFSWGGNGATLGRLKATKIMVPVTTEDPGTSVVDWDGIELYGRWLAAQAAQYMDEALR